MRSCILCRQRPAAVPDRNRPGRPVKRICRECHAERIANDLWDALRRSVPPCRVCNGSGFIAQKQFIDDGYGEVDSCPACEAPKVKP